MLKGLLDAGSLRVLTADGRLLFLTRCLRLFAYGFLSVVLMLYLVAVGLSDSQIGWLFTLTLLGDTVVSLWLTTHADRLGRKKMLLLGAALMMVAGVVFAVSGNFLVLLIAATVGVISPSGNEVGPFLPIEQAALSQGLDDGRRTAVFAWYNLVGSFSMSLGALSGGGIAQLLADHGFQGASQFRPVVIGYAICGLALMIAFARLSDAAEVPEEERSISTVGAATTHRFGLHKSQGVILRLAALFGLDSFGGGFIIQAVVAFWFSERFRVEPATIGAILFAANLLAGISALAAVWLACRIGLVKTMVLTHLPSNVLLLLVPLMPNLPLAILVLLVRYSISQMDVPTRQAYTVSVVAPDERSAAAGVTGVARSVGASLSPVLAAILVGNPTLLNAPFYLAGAIKIAYDLLLYWSFVHSDSKPMPA
jgi:MFS family permease